MIRQLIDFFLESRKADRERKGEEKNLWRLLWSQPVRTRVRFGRRGLVRLLEAGWYQGREWDVDQLEAFRRRFPAESGHPALDVLREFGGLDIWHHGRGLMIGQVEDRLCHSREIIDTLTGARLYPVGWTNIFEDDGLGVHVDEQGKVYVDGATGDAPPKDQRLDLIALKFDEFLHEALAPRPSKEIRIWYYHLGSAEDVAGD